MKNKDPNDVFIEYSKSILHLFKSTINNLREITDAAKELKTELYETIHSTKSQAKDIDSHKAILREKQDYVNKAKEVHDMGLGAKLSSNSAFIYMIALFENFLTNYMQALLYSRKDYFDKYKQIFLNFALKQQKDKGDDKYVSMLANDKKMIENFDEIKDKLKVFTNVLGIATNKQFETAINEFVEHRERRNLLVHRSTVADHKYEKSIKTSGISKKVKDVEKFINEFKKHSTFTSVEQEMNGELDLSVDSIYLSRVFANIHRIITNIGLYASLDENNKFVSSPVGSTLNEFLIVMYYELNYIDPIGIFIDLVTDIEKNTLKNDLTLIKDDFFKVNMILAALTMNEHLKKDSKKTIFRVKDYVKFIEDDLIRDLITSFISRDYKKYLENLEEYVKTYEYSVTELPYWFMNLRLFEDKEFENQFKKIFEKTA